MLGPPKPRRLDEPIAVSLEDLVPPSNFYRHLEAKLDLSFVREWTRELYAERGRPSIDPVVFFKLQLVMFFEGIRSERKLIETATSQPGPPLVPRLRPRRGPARPLQPDPHPAAAGRRRSSSASSSRSSICARRRAWSGAASSTSMPPRSRPTPTSIPLVPRFYYDAKTHVAELFADDAAEPGRRPLSENVADGLPEAWSSCRRADDARGRCRAAEPPWRLLEERRLDPHRPAVGSYRADDRLRASAPTDPDATPDADQHGTALGYHDHYVVDGGKPRIILAALVTPADVMENVPLRDLLWRVCFRRKLRPRQVTGDTTYGTSRTSSPLEDAGIRAFFPLPDFDRRTPFYRQDAGSPTMPSTMRTAARRGSRCHAARPSTPRQEVRLPSRRGDLQRLPGQSRSARPATTAGSCTAPSMRTISTRVRGYHATEAYQKAMRKRKVWVEPLFAEAKEWHGLRRLRLARPHEREHPGAADRGRAEPEALPGRNGLGPASCSVWEPAGPSAGARTALAV